MDRRQLIKAGLAAPLALSAPAAAQATIPIGDMHFHSFFGPSSYHSRPVAPMMAAGGATLVAWKLVGDLLWIEPRTLKQKEDPKAGVPLDWFERELGRIKAHCAEQKLKLVLTPAEVDLAVKGEPHIVLAVEGASFIESDAGRVKRAYDLGVRHIQLVHYIRNGIGDFQTEPAEHKQLTGLGREVVQECNRLGILIDLAHCSDATARGALSLSKAPMVWSHGSVTRAQPATQKAILWRRRQLPLEIAKAIAQQGGVVGLWALTLDIGKTIEAYGDRLMELSSWLGDDHVGFGTDINGLGPNAILSNYAEVRKVVEHWQRQKLPEARIRKLAIGNYARVLKQALVPKV